MTKPWRSSARRNTTRFLVEITQAAGPEASPKKS